MKRSDLEYKIAILLMESGYDLNYTASQGLGLLILDLIEKEGMEPPIRDRMIEGHECDENSWEPEND